MECARPMLLILGLRESDGEIAMAKRLGFEVALMGKPISLDDAIEADLPIEIDLNDEDAAIAAALELAARRPLAGVFTLNEYRVALTARMSRALGLSRGLSPEAAATCRSKRLTREALARVGLSPIRHVVVRQVDEVDAAVAKVGLPCIVKPSNDAGSNRVARCDSVAAARGCASDILAHSTNYIGQLSEDCVLVEEFLSGPEYSVESYTHGGRTTNLGITEKLPSPPPGTIEVGHLTPARLSREDRAAIEALVADALAVVRVSEAVTHVEVKLTAAGPRIVEINARPGGDRIAMLTEAVTGVDLREVSLRLAVGLPPLGGSVAPRAEASAIRFLLADTSGKVRLGNVYAAKSRVMELRLSVRDGDIVAPTTSNYDRLGHVAATGATPEAALAAIAAALEILDFKTDPNEAEKPS